MKKLVSILLVLTLVLSFTGCGSKDKKADDDKAASATPAAGTSDTAATTAPTAAPTAATASEGTDGYELALVTDIGTIDDKSFNQGAWEGLKQYAEEKGISYKYYQPTEKTTDAYIASIDLAVEGGAKLVVCPGYLFEEAVFVAQDDYPDVKFILLDGTPNHNYEEFKLNPNVYSVFYAEEQAGFLAGYAAVKDGYTKLGFMGGMAVPAVIRYGYGFIQGADYAAKEMGVASIDLKYHYTGDFKATPEVQAMAASWYEAGTEVIFGCGGAVGNSVMAAAEAAGKNVIGVDVDQSPESDTVITSAMKMLSKSVYDGITAFYAGTFPGGQSVTLNVTQAGVGLPMETSKFKTFTQADYDAVYQKLVSGEITLVKDTDADSNAVTIDKVPVTVTKVEEIK